MATIAPDQQPASASRRTDRSPRGAHRAPREVQGLAIAIGILVLASIVVFADVSATRGKVFSGVQVAGVDIGGETPERAASMLGDRAEELARTELRFRLAGEVVTTTPGELGWMPDAAGTAEAAMRVGRTGPWSRVWDRARGMLGSISVPWEGRLNRDAYARVLAEWDGLLGDPPREGSVRVVDGEAIATPPSPGRGVDRDVVLSTLRAALAGEATGTVALPSTPVQPLTTTEDVQAATEDVREALSAPIEVRIRDERLTLAPEELGPAIRTTVEAHRDDSRVRLILRPAHIEDLLDPFRDEFEVPARDASFATEGKGARVRPSRPGRELSGALAAVALARIALSDDREGRVGLVRARPEFTTQEAEDLGITERISLFTTYFPAGEHRVTNIQLGADTLNGAIVEPGDTFSLNDRLGERTLAGGYVVAPAIVDGKFDEQVGGGISQLTTTLFNAAFFAGYPFLEYQAHSYYFDRYPLGREATLSWPSPDLAFRNDTSRAAYIAASTTSTSVTVAVYGTSTREVVATDPEIVSESSAGYTVVLERIVRRGDDVVRRESFRTYYRDPSLAEEPQRDPGRPRNRRGGRSGSNGGDDRTGGSAGEGGGAGGSGGGGGGQDS